MYVKYSVRPWPKNQDNYFMWITSCIIDVLGSMKVIGSQITETGICNIKGVAPPTFVT